MFKKKYKIEECPLLKEIVSDEVEFYAHCDSRHGIRVNLWVLYGNSQDVGDLKKPLFRDTNDHGNIISKNWYVWHIGEEFLHVGKLKGEHRNADIGIVASAKSMYEWVKCGSYQGVRPRFE